MAGKQNQLALELRHRMAVGRDDFLVSPSNEEAVAWIDRWPDWPGPAVVLVGAPGCGKTHLGQVWGQSAGAVEYVGRNTAICSSQPCVFVDNAESADDDEEFFHVFNAVVAAGGFLLVAARTPPVRWVKRLSDLTSRLSAAPNIRIHPPDEALMAAVMIKMFADQKMDVGAEVITYLINRMERSFEMARTLVRRLNNASLAKQRGVTIPLVREEFEEMSSGM